MATLQAATTSNGAIVTDEVAVSELCGRYDFGMLDWRIEDDGTFSIWGYDSFEVYSTRDDGLPDHENGVQTEEFLTELVAYLVDGEELDIRTAGFTKCRFPVLAQRYVIYDGAVLHADLTGLEPIDE